MNSLNSVLLHPATHSDISSGSVKFSASCKVFLRTPCPMNPQAAQRPRKAQALPRQTHP